MNHIKHITLALLLLANTFCLAQKLTLNELHTISTNKNWETSNKYLLAKGWEFYNSSAGDDVSYNTISWAFQKSRIDDTKANGWFYIYTYQDMPNKIIYRFRQKEYYKSLIQQIHGAGYKLEGEEIEDKLVVATYKNPKYTLEMSYERVEDDDYSYSGSYTVYNLTVYKKGGVYDPNNGKKYDYDEDGSIASSYFLKDGKMDGEITLFNPNGTIRKTTFMKSGIENGLSTEYIYSDEDNDSIATVIGKIKGQIIDGKKNGKWESIAMKDYVEYPLNFENYTNDIKNGPFREVIKDSIFYGTYSNDLLEGNYTIYKDIKKMLIGGFAETDSLKLKKICIGNFKNNKRHGLWKNYDFSGTLISEGNYADNLKIGKWKYYYQNYIDKDGKDTPYSGKLYLEENYQDGKLEGESNQYSLLENEEVPCNNNESAPCFSLTYTPVTLRMNYKNGKLDGDYEFLEENGEILQKGLYENGYETGRWILQNKSSILNSNEYTFEYGNFAYGKRTGNWERKDKNNVLISTYTMNNDELNGDYILYANDKPIEKRHFTNDQFDGFTILDANQVPVVQYELTNITTSKYDCKKTEKLNTGTKIQTYQIVLTVKDTINPFSFNKDFEKLPDYLKKLNGRYQFKNANDQLMEEGDYYSNNKGGTWTTNHWEQNVRTVYMYSRYGNIENEYYHNIKKDEPFSGEFIYINEDRTMYEERKIKDGKRNGTTRYKDANDKTLKKESYKDGILKE